ncbi:MAG: hypothetical protein ACLTS6_04505 [Anaerobutyricum sp.]
MKQRNKQKRILLLTAILMFAFACFRFNTIDAQAASKYTIYVNRRDKSRECNRFKNW